MAIEIEVLVPVKEPKESALRKLGSLGEPIVKKTVDTYYFDPLRTDLAPDPSGRLLHCLRVRKADGPEGMLTWKDDFFDASGAWTHSDEIETPAQPETIAAILQKMGLKELMRLEMEKTIWTTPDYNVIFEDVAGLGLFLEVEARRGQEAELLECRKRIDGFIGSLGVSVGPETTAGKPEMMLRKAAR